MTDAPQAQQSLSGFMASCVGMEAQSLCAHKNVTQRPSRTWHTHTHTHFASPEIVVPADRGSTPPMVSVAARASLRCSTKM